MREQIQRTKNNQGYTLLELVVAITILALIAIPLMHGFVTAAKTNQKAREIEHATTVAQNVMEEIKVTPVEELLEDVKPSKVSSLTESGEYVDTFSYHVTCEEVETDGVPYHVDVWLDNGPYSSGIFEYITNHNLTEMAQLYDMNAAYDAFYILEETTDTALIEELAVATGVDEAVVRADVERNIYLDIQEERGTRTVWVNVSYTYRNKTRYMAADNQCIYSSSSSDTYLRNVYVFFQPLDNMQAGDRPKETVTVRNTCCTEDKEPVQIYLVKQGTSYHADYKVAVNLMEQPRGLDTYQNADGSLRVMTRICTNLSFPKDETDTADEQIIIKYSTWDGGYQERTSEYGGLYTADELAGLTDLSAGEVQDWVYSVRVEVREKDADEYGDALVYLTGTKEK